MTAFEYLKQLHEVCQFQTKEGQKYGIASNSELRRWLKNGVLYVNHHRVTEDEIMDYTIQSVYLFPKRRITLL